MGGGGIAVSGGEHLPALWSHVPLHGGVRRAVRGGDVVLRGEGKRKEKEEEKKHFFFVTGVDVTVNQDLR